MRRLLLALGLVLASGVAHADTFLTATGGNLLTVTGGNLIITASSGAPTIPSCPVIPFVFPPTSINPTQVNTNFTSVRDCINRVINTINTGLSVNLAPPVDLTDSKTAGITTDGFALNVRSNSTYAANQIYQMTTTVSASTYDSIRGVAVSTPGTTVEGVTAVAGYAVAATPTGSPGNSGNAVALFGVGVSAVDASVVWGINTLLTDTTVPGVVSSGVARQLWNELDFNVTSTGTTVHGLLLSGASIAQPASAVGFEVAPLGTAKKWSTAFGTQAGAAVNGLALGQQDLVGVALSPSQYLLMAWSDGAGVTQDHFFQSNNGDLIMDSTAAGMTGNFVLNKGAFRTADGGSLAGLVLGQRIAAAESSSQTLHFSWMNALSAPFNVALQTDNFGQLNVLTNGGVTTGSLNLPSGARYMLNGTPGVNCSGSPTGGFTTVGGIVTAC